MPVSQTRNADAQLLGSADHLLASDRNFVFSAYNTGNQIIDGTASTLNMDTVTVNHAPEMFELEDDILTILIPGVYLLRVFGAAIMGGGGAGQIAVFLQEDAAVGSFFDIPAAISYTYLPASLHASFDMTHFVYARADYRYRIRAFRSSGASSISTSTGSVGLAAMLIYSTQ